MTLSKLASAAILGLALTACDSMPAIPSWVPFIGKKEEPPPAPVVAQPAPDTTTPPPVEAPPPPPPRVVADEPWTPVDTGTVAPGMTREQVIALWGVPVSERVQGEWLYLYFRNGCEYSCGMFDLVLLQNGAVVDAVLRGPGHNYSGESSSPPGKLPERTPPGGTTVTVPVGGT
jgi:hypothetical protein